MNNFSDFQSYNQLTEGLMTTQEVASLFGVSTRTFLDMGKYSTGRPTHFKMGHYNYYAKENLDAWLAKLYVPGANEPRWAAAGKKKLHSTTPELDRVMAGVLTTEQLAAKLGKTSRQFLEMGKYSPKGHPGHYRIGKRNYYPLDAVDSWLASLRVPSTNKKNSQTAVATPQDR